MSAILELYRAGPPMRSVLKQILQFYASNINQSIDVGGNTILHYASCCGDHDMVVFLLELGANAYKNNNARDMPIHYMRRHGYL
jgi:ankyrin repeat protein